MKRYNVSILVARIHCFVYISNVVVTRGYPFVFIIFVLESMVIQVVQIVLLLVVLCPLVLAIQSCMMAL